MLKSDFTKRQFQDIETPKAQISVILVVRNEEKKIRRCLDSILWVDDIIVVDQSSKDNTAAICGEYTDTVFTVPPKGYCEPDRAMAASKARNKWILYLDADEVVSYWLREEIEQAIRCETSYGAYYISRKNIFMDKWIKGSGWHPGYVLRLFKNGSVKFSDQIHVDIQPLVPAGYLNNPLTHYTCENLDEYLCKMNSYTSILASQAYAKGRRIERGNRVRNLVLLPLAYAINKYIFKAGFRDGFRGLLIAFLTCLTVFMMHAKLWETQYYDTGKMDL